MTFVIQAAKQNAAKKRSKKSSGINLDEMNEDLEMDETNLMMEDDEDTNDQSMGEMGEVQTGTQGAAPTTSTRLVQCTVMFWKISSHNH